MASEKAKALAAKQKAEAQAEKQRKKNSENPADWGRFKQIFQAYKVTKEYDKQLTLWLAGAFLGTVLLLTVIGIFLTPWWMYTIMGILLGLTAMLAVLTWRVRGATFKRYEGQAGSAEVALQMLPKGWLKPTIVAVTRHQDVVHRVLGPGGIVLVGEGEAGRVRALLQTEAKKHEQIAYGAKVTSIMMGDKGNQVPLAKLTNHVKKLPKAMEPSQVVDVQARLRALDAVRPKAPIPRGPIPTSSRGSRQAMRGR